MGLKDRLTTPPPVTPRRGRMDLWLERLPGVEQEAVLNAVRDPEWQHRVLLKILMEEGAPPISASSFAHWRRSRGLL